MRHQVSLGQLLDRVDLALDGAGRPKAKHFTRKRALTIPVMVGMLLTMVSDAGRLGYRYLLHQFWITAKSIRFPLFQELPADSSAFCRARQKLPWQFLQALFLDVAAKFETKFGKQLRWKGRRILAADGVKLTLPRNDGLDRAFGRPKRALRPMIAVVTIFDVLARVTIGVAFGRYASGERTLLAETLRRVPVGSILLLDRGFPGFALLSDIAKGGIDFVARAPRTFGAVKRFLKTGRARGTITLVRRKDRATSVPETLKLRIERVPNGKEELVLVTTLSCQVASRGEVVRLYLSRLDVETEFRVLKISGFGEDCFHSRTAAGIKQEVCARLLFLNFARSLLAEAAARAGRPITDLAPKSAQAMLGHTEVILLMTFRLPRAAQLLAFALDLIARSRAEQRRGRHFPRVSNKSKPKWGPHGRTGRWND